MKLLTSPLTWAVAPSVSDLGLL